MVLLSDRGCSAAATVAMASSNYACSDVCCEVMFDYLSSPLPVSLFLILIDLRNHCLLVLIYCIVAYVHIYTGCSTVNFSLQLRFSGCLHLDTSTVGIFQSH